MTIIEFSGVLDLPSFGSSESAAEAAMASGVRWMHERNGHQSATRPLADRLAATTMEA